jgi:hypothetical protein
LKWTDSEDGEELGVVVLAVVVAVVLGSERTRSKQEGCDALALSEVLKVNVDPFT